MFPHNPVFASEDFLGKSKNGIYGDAVEELDWSTGQILETLEDLGIDNSTLVLFTSDNGASDRFGGSNSPLSDWKGGIGEGGFRVPCIIRMPSKIPAGVVSNALMSTLDLLPTFARITGTTVPQDRIIDGLDMWSHLTKEDSGSALRETFFYYRVEQLQAARSGRWKLYLGRDDWRKISWNLDREKSEMKLFDLEEDISEENNVADQYPDVVQRLVKIADEMINDIGDTRKEGANQRKAGHKEVPKALVMKTTNSGR